MLEDGVDATRPARDRGVAGSSIDTVTAFWMATVGGAAVLDVPVGLLEVGRYFDAFEKRIRSEAHRNMGERLERSGKYDPSAGASAP